MYVQTRTLRSLNGLGDVCAVLTNGARICGPSVNPKAVVTTGSTPPVASPVLATGVVPTYAAGAVATPSAVNDPNCIAAGMLGGPYPNCTPNPYAVAAPASSGITATLTGTTILGFPLWMWLAGGAGFYLLFLRRR